MKTSKKESLVRRMAKADNEASCRRAFCRTGSIDNADIRIRVAARRKSSRSRPSQKEKIRLVRARLICPGTRTVSRCAECGALLSSLTDPVGKCPKCGFALHACKQCEHFDPSCRFECNQPIPARISPKDKLNDCQSFSIRVMVEKETSSKGSQRPNDARQAFENLFKK